jgi:hypothetical protein
MLAASDAVEQTLGAGLQTGGGAPKISAFMRFVGETGTIFRPGAARWALLFMDGSCDAFRPIYRQEKADSSARAFGMTTPCMLRSSAGGLAAFFGTSQKADASAKDLRNDNALYVAEQRRRLGGVFRNEPKGRFLGQGLRNDNTLYVAV